MRWRKRHESKLKLTDGGEPLPKPYRKRDVGRRWQSRIFFRGHFESRHSEGCRIGKKHPEPATHEDLQARPPSWDWRGWKEGKRFSRQWRKIIRRKARGRRQRE